MLLTLLSNAVKVTEEGTFPDEDDAELRTVHPLLDGTRTLVVDDNETNRQLLGQMMERCGMEATTAAAGDEALGRLSEDPDSYDVLLLDVHIAGWDGLALLDRVRKFWRKWATRPMS